MSDIVYLTEQLWARVRRMLQAFEGGHLGPVYTSAPVSRKLDETITLKIASNASGGGKYWATLLQPVIDDIQESGDLTEAEIGTVFEPSNEAIKFLALNTPEKGKTTHALAVGTVCLGHIHRRQDNGTMVVLITAYFEEDC